MSIEIPRLEADTGRECVARHPVAHCLRSSSCCRATFASSWHASMQACRPFRRCCRGRPGKPAGQQSQAQGHSKQQTSRLSLSAGIAQGCGAALTGVGKKSRRCINVDGQCANLRPGTRLGRKVDDKARRESALVRPTIECKPCVTMVCRCLETVITSEGIYEHEPFIVLPKSRIPMFPLPAIEHGCCKSLSTTSEL